MQHLNCLAQYLFFKPFTVLIEDKRSIMKRHLVTILLTLCINSIVLNSYAAPIIIDRQGTFAVGGTIKKSQGVYTPKPSQIISNDNNVFWDVYLSSIHAGGQTMHADHASVFYQIPINAKKYPLIFLHGYGQSARSWQTTPDGREGFNTLFLKQNYSIYLVDQPRQGQAGQSSVASEISAIPDDQFWYAQFRIGVYPKMNEGVSFPKDHASLQQFFRQMTPSTGIFDINIVTQSMVDLFEKTGNAILVTHSAAGIVGWNTAIQSDQVKAIVAYEPGNFLFPEGEAPATMYSRFGNVTPMSTSMAKFKKLTTLPIIIYFGDFIPPYKDETQGGEQWYIRLELAKQWAEAVNKYGGNVTLIELPRIGIHGNTHFPFSDLNNIEVAEHLSKWLKEQRLD